MKTMEQEAKSKNRFKFIKNYWKFIVLGILAILFMFLSLGES